MSICYNKIWVSPTFSIQIKNTTPWCSINQARFGEPTNINVELLFRDLFALRDRFKELGMVIKNGEVYLPDLEERDI